MILIDWDYKRAPSYPACARRKSLPATQDQALDTSVSHVDDLFELLCAICAEYAQTH